ncbi:MAG: hypothetical protein IPH74_13300 [Bacteroidetes bacterium]|nr:hypothetical protein [Bacteroidota bacterium]
MKNTKEPQYLVSPNATNNNTVSDEIKICYKKGIALTVTQNHIFIRIPYNDFVEQAQGAYSFQGQC